MKTEASKIRKHSVRSNLPSAAEERLVEAAWKETLSAVTLGFIHDLNNNLTGILGLTELLLIEAKPEGAVLENLNQIKRGTRQAAELMERLAVLHRARMGRSEWHDLNALVAQGLEFLRRAVPKRLQLIAELSTTTLPILADAVAFQHAFASIILGAAHFTPGQGRIVIQTASAENRGATKTAARAGSSDPAALLTVKTADARVPARVLSTLLEPWVAPKSKGGKSGVGLFAARRFAEHHGGTFAVDSNATSGLIVHLLLPAADLGGDASSAPE